MVGLTTARWAPFLFCTLSLSLSLSIILSIPSSFVYFLSFSLKNKISLTSPAFTICFLWLEKGFFFLSSNQDHRFQLDPFGQSLQSFMSCNFPGLINFSSFLFCFFYKVFIFINGILGIILVGHSKVQIFSRDLWDFFFFLIF